MLNVTCYGVHSLDESTLSPKNGRKLNIDYYLFKISSWYVDLPLKLKHF